MPVSVRAGEVSICKDRVYLLMARAAGSSLWENGFAWVITDVPLAQSGAVQAMQLAQRFVGLPIRTVYSSDLRRSSQTAQILADTLAAVS